MSSIGPDAYRDKQGVVWLNSRKYRSPRTIKEPTADCVPLWFVDRDSSPLEQPEYPTPEPDPTPEPPPEPKAEQMTISLTHSDHPWRLLAGAVGIVLGLALGVAVSSDRQTPPAEVIVTTPAPPVTPQPDHALERRLQWVEQRRHHALDRAQHAEHHAAVLARTLHRVLKRRR